MFRYLLLVILLASPTVSAQGIVPFDTLKAVDTIVDRVIQLRHQIHQSPELGNREFKTAQLVADHLRSLGLDVTTGVAHTGVIGILRGALPGGVVALRADMDALPITEDTPLSSSRPLEPPTTVRTSASRMPVATTSMLPSCLVWHPC